MHTTSISSHYYVLWQQPHADINDNYYRFTKNTQRHDLWPFLLRPRQRLRSIVMSMSVCGSVTSAGWRQSSRKKLWVFHASRAIIILFQRLSQQKVYVIMTFIYQGHSTSTTTHVTNKSLSSYIDQINSFCAPDTLGCIWIAWHRLHPECKVTWGCTEFRKNSMSFSCSEKFLSIPGFRGLWPPEVLWCCWLGDIKNSWPLKMLTHL